MTLRKFTWIMEECEQEHKGLSLREVDRCFEKDLTVLLKKYPGCLVKSIKSRGLQLFGVDGDLKFWGFAKDIILEAA